MLYIFLYLFALYYKHFYCKKTQQTFHSFYFYFLFELNKVTSITRCKKIRISELFPSFLVNTKPLQRSVELLNVTIDQSQIERRIWSLPPILTLSFVRPFSKLSDTFLPCFDRSLLGKYKFSTWKISLNLNSTDPSLW